MTTLLEILEQPLVLALIRVLIVFTALSLIVAYLVYAERKILAHIQVRLGPMRVGPHGLLQPIADGLKLLLKEDIIPEGADRAVFWLAPTITVLASFTAFALIPFADNFYVTDVNVGLLFVIAITSALVCEFAGVGPNDSGPADSGRGGCDRNARHCIRRSGQVISRLRGARPRTHDDAARNS